MTVSEMLHHDLLQALAWALCLLSLCGAGTLVAIAILKADTERHEASFRRKLGTRHGD